MAIFRSSFAPLVVGACALVLGGCGDGGGDEPLDSMDATTTGQATLTSTLTGTQGSPATTGGTTTSAQLATTALTSTTTTGASTTGGSGAGGTFSDTTGGDATSTAGLGGAASTGTLGGSGGATGSGGASITSSVTGAGGAGGVGGSISATSTGGSSGGSSECEFSGNISYQFNNPSGWPSDVVELLTNAMDEAMFYYNCYADLSKELTINYDPGVPTAQGNVDGWISFGSSRSYMVVATAMHEVAHTLGVGYSPWAELMNNGTWTGPAVVEFMMNLPAEQRDPDMYSQRSYITGDSQHFWPYGLNQASEHQSEWSLINHVRIVAAMQRDKQAYLAGEL